MHFWNKHRNSVDFDKPVENPKLKQAFEKLHINNTYFYYRKVLDEIEVANFLLLVIDKHLNNIDTTVNFITVKDDDGAVYLPLFTDDNEAQSHIPTDNGVDIAAFVIDIVSVSKMALNEAEINGVVINPGSDKWTMNKQFLSHLLGDRK